MTTVAGEIKAFLSGARAAVGMVKRIDSSEALKEKFKESVADVEREVGQVSYAVCKALVAHAMESEPSEDDVADFMTLAVNDPTFPNRAYRLLGETRKTSSRRRRKFLASMLFGLPFAKLPDDEIDRVDMVVERMTVADVEFLWKTSEKRVPETKILPGPRQLFGPAGVGMLVEDKKAWIVTAATWARSDFEMHMLERLTVSDRTALAALVSMGCMEVGPPQRNMRTEGMAHHLLFTALGDLVVAGMKAVRPGYEGDEDDGERTR